NLGTDVSALTADSLGNLYASNIDPDALISKLDASGNLVWSYAVAATPQTQYVSTWSAAHDGADGLFLSGNIYGHVTSVGLADVVVIRLSEVPEPSTIANALSGLLLLASLPILTRRRRQLKMIVP